MMSRLLRPSRRLVAPALLALLAACGGGGGGADTSPPGSTQGSLSLSFSSGATSGVDHVWVTITQVALNADANRAWSPDDNTWQVVRLPSPVLVDLVPLANGLVSAFLYGQALPAGTYGQLRVFLKPHDSELTNAARDQHLLYNAQVDATDAAGTARHLPLEIPAPELGLRIEGQIVVKPDEGNEVTLEWDLAHNLARFKGDDGVDRYTVKPELRPLHLSATAAVAGLMDPAPFCPAGVRAAHCVYDVVATALMPSADGRYKRAVRTAPVVVNGGYGKFALYPLPAGTTIDVVIRGRNMQTMVVRDVPATPADLLHATPIQLGGNPADPHLPVPMVPVVRAEGDAMARLAAPLAERSALLRFMQTLPGAGQLPLELTATLADPFSGLLSQPVPLPSGPLRVATYRDKEVLSFADVEPSEGRNRYTLVTEGPHYDDASVLVVAAAEAAVETPVNAPEPTRKPGLAEATLTVSIAGGSTAKYDAASLVVADANGIVLTRDVSAQIGGGQAAVALPAGAAAGALGGTGVYSVSVRAWKRAAPDGAQWARAGSAVDLRGGGGASVSVTLP